MSFCVKRLESAAKTHASPSTSPQNAALQTAANPTPIPALTPEPDDTARFFDLWLAQPSWSPITKNQHGWKTILSTSGKKVPLKIDTIESHYRRGVILGKRFSRLTNYLMIDIDIGSPYHPRNGLLKPILEALERLGLCRYLIVRSSDSGGLHIYFPLAEPVSSWAIACAAHAALTSSGIKVSGGICELFPNKKAYKAEHHGHRLPLQAGSIILDEDLSPLSNCPSVFVQLWQTAAQQQTAPLSLDTVDTKATVQPTQPKQTPTGPLPPIAWTDSRQSNEIMRQLVNYGDRYAGKKTVNELAEWIIEVAPQMQGFAQFASRESRDDLLRRNWAYRWSKCHFKKKWEYIAQTASDYNQSKSDQAKMRIVLALKELGSDIMLGRKKLWHKVCEVCRRLFAIAPSYTTFISHWKLVESIAREVGDLTPSAGSKEDVKLFASEDSRRRESEAELGPKKPPPKLSTGRFDPAIEDGVLSRVQTPPESESQLPFEPAIPPPNTAEVEPHPPELLSKGQSVVIKLSGCPMHGVRTRVRGKTRDKLGRRVYRLDYRVGREYMMLPIECLTVVDTPKQPSPVQQAIRATAAQLREVLGQACPFVGPGLWTVRRDEVTPKAWRQLNKLVTET